MTYQDLIQCRSYCVQRMTDAKQSNDPEKHRMWVRIHRHICEQIKTALPITETPQDPIHL